MLGLYISTEDLINTSAKLLFENGHITKRVIITNFVYAPESGWPMAVVTDGGIYAMKTLIGFEDIQR